MPRFQCPTCRQAPVFVSRIFIEAECEICCLKVSQLICFGPCGHTFCQRCWDRLYRTSEDRPLVFDMREAYTRRRYRPIEDEVLMQLDDTLPMEGTVTPPSPPAPVQPPPVRRHPALRPKAKAGPPRLPQLPGQGMPSTVATPNHWVVYYYESFAEGMWFPWQGQLVQWAFECRHLLRPILVRRATVGVSFMNDDSVVPPGLAGWIPVWDGEGELWTLYMPAGVYEGLELARVGPWLY